MRRYDLQRVQRDALFPRLKPIEVGPVESPIESLGNPDGTRLENLLETAPALEIRQGAVEVELAPHSSAIYLELPSQKPVRN